MILKQGMQHGWDLVEELLLYRTSYYIIKCRTKWLTVGLQVKLRLVCLMKMQWTKFHTHNLHYHLHMHSVSCLSHLRSAHCGVSLR